MSGLLGTHLRLIMLPLERSVLKEIVYDRPIAKYDLELIFDVKSSRAVPELRPLLFATARWRCIS